MSILELIWFVSLIFLKCDLVIFANGKTEKIASGLLSPFLAHLKAARDQMAKGGYSIILEPEAGCNATWFTKATVERFVRFVSTPEVLERVYTLESEIMQIEEAIAIQSNNDVGLQTREGHQAKSAEVTEAVKPVLDDNADKAIVLYKPDSHLPEANGSAGQEGNSKVQLLKVLETRKTVLQKEQGMAFARAVAAGFDIDLLTPLMSFAESFGASRLMDACTKFIDLWKRKHENGQWVEIEEAEALSGHLDYANMNASGIVISDMVNKLKVSLPESSNDMASEENGKASTTVNADDKPPMNQHVPLGYPEYFPGQFPHMFPPWPMHSPPGAPLGFQAYPMPYFQNYPGSNPYFQQASPPVEDPRLHSGQKVCQKRHSHERRNSNTGLISSDVDGFNGRSSDEHEQEDVSSPSESQKKGRRSKKKQGMVVIRNINYITRKQQDPSHSESDSASEPKSDGEYEPLEGAATLEMKHKHSTRSQERRQSGRNSINKLTSSDKEEPSYGNEADGEHWQAFQSYLLKEADEGKQEGDQGMFSMEKEVWLKRRKNVLNNDPLASDGRNIDEPTEGLSTDVQRLSGSGAFIRRASNDGLLISRKDGDSRSFLDGHLDVHSTEIRGRGGYRWTETDDFIINKQENSLSVSASDRLAMNRYEGGAKFPDIRSSQDIDDDSYIVSYRSASADFGDGSQKGIDIDSEFPSAEQRKKSSSRKVQVSYEPDELSMMPERGVERESNGYDPALDYEMQVENQACASLNKSGKEAGSNSKQRSKDSKRSQTPDVLAKKKNVGPVRKGKPTKLSPLDEAKARAERLRSYKADLQKLKKEKEEEQIKRIEALKLERQKRIAARSSSIPAHSPQTSQPSRKSLPTKLSPSSHKGSKFSDMEPGSSSPLQRFSVRSASKPNRLTAGSSSAENRLTRSASSLPETKKENSVVPEKKASMTRIRRLSEPKMTANNCASTVKPRAESTKSKVSDDADKKKISAIINLDRSKAATLPELKIRATKAPESAKSMNMKEMPLKVNGTVSKPGMSSRDTVLKANDEQNSQQIEDDDNPIVEKSVVVLENEKPAVPVSHVIDEKLQPLSSGDHNDQIDGEITNAFPKQSSSCAVVSPATVGGSGSDGKPQENKMKEQISTYELATHEEASSKVSSVSHVEKPYQAPYARVSSLEDPCTIGSEYAKALPTACSDLRATGAQSFKAQVAVTSKTEIEKITDPADKPSKESAKGFKRLLKFGKKNNTSSERDSDTASIGGSDIDDNASKPAPSTEVHTLKNLISQDETPTAVTTPKKSSRALSLLSPFRSKHSEKKHAT
ncbi:hypothetical protein CDL15_Pgr011949 [Punica granatum]|uniref:COP1-interacting protein 7 n=1 Tax=Punica granatum TaxID=22663 RepID=A0A218WD78_PUNGR|nr:hypothetical protein CDL15_Pgr011949 [Punica granatum]